MNYNSLCSNQPTLCSIASQVITEQLIDRSCILTEQQNKQINETTTDELPDVECKLKKGQDSKYKCRKYKEKLNILCANINKQLQGAVNKQYSSQSKSRLLALAIQLEKMTLSQSRDYISMQLRLKELIKIVDLKRQCDLLILKQSRLIPAICNYLIKVPSLLKNEFNLSMNSLELCLKLLYVFCTLSHNREFVLCSNLLLILNNCLTVLLQKNQTKLSTECIKILTLLISGTISADIQQIVQLTLNIVAMSTLIKRIKTQIQQWRPQQNAYSEQFMLKLLRYLTCIYSRLFGSSQQKPIYTETQLSQSLRIFSQSITSSLSMLLHTCTTEYDMQQMPICFLNIIMYSLKIISMCLRYSLKSNRSILITEYNKENLTFSNCHKLILEYVCQQISTNSENSRQIEQIYAEGIQIIAMLCWNHNQTKQYMLQSGILEILFNHPIKYIMDADLKSILLPCLCSVMCNHSNAQKQYFSENSTHTLLKYLNAQIKTYQMKLMEEQEDYQLEFKLGRKDSQSSFTTQGTQKSQIISSSTSLNNVNSNDEREMMALLKMLPYQQWHKMHIQIAELEDC